MSTLRRSIFAIVAICVAFAAGIALGNGPLQGSDRSKKLVSVAASDARMHDALRALHQQRALTDALARAAGPSLLHGDLADASVGIFVLPGVPQSRVAAIGRAVRLAGGEVSVVANLSSTLIDPAKKTYVDSVATNSLKGAKDLTSAADSPTYARIGALIARAYTGPRQRLVVDDEATGLDAQLQGAKLVRLPGPVQRRADAVIVLGTAENGGSNAVYASHQIELQLIDALSARSEGVVVAAPGGAGRPGGLIAQVHTSKLLTHAVATLDMVDLPGGVIATVGALAAAVSGRPEAFGISSGHVVLPPALRTAR